MQRSRRRKDGFDQKKTAAADNQLSYGSQATVNCEQQREALPLCTTSVMLSSNNNSSIIITRNTLIYSLGKKKSLTLLEEHDDQRTMIDRWKEEEEEYDVPRRLSLGLGEVMIGICSKSNNRERIKRAEEREGTAVVAG